MVGDKGLVVKNVAAHHAISAKFPKKIDNKGKTLVVQYEVKPQSRSYQVLAIAWNILMPVHTKTPLFAVVPT
jgi:hypothetical protein